ncbi:dTDP-4-dehydrorhamnose 3,5-epimerase [soil metagenome]
MEYITTQLHDAKLLKPKVFNDERGFFLEVWRQNAFDDLLNNGKPLIFKQDNHNASRQHILRGLHFQYLKPQGKLVRAIAGEIYDVIVDMRQSSPSFGMWQGFYLSASNKHILWVPPGFAHGFYTISETAEVCYKCTDYYNPGDEYSILWNDPDLAIDWPFVHSSPPELSQKDGEGVLFRDALKYA